jgi:hypothetical protein
MSEQLPPQRPLASRPVDPVEEKIWRVMGVGFVVAWAGFGIAWLAPEPRGGHVLMLLGWAVCAVGVLTGGVGVIWHFAHHTTKTDLDRET